MKAPSRPLDNVRLVSIVERQDALHAGLPSTHRPRLVWQRDKTILLLIHLTGWTYRKVRKLKVSDFPLQVESLRDLDDGKLDEIKALLHSYLHETRCHLAGAASGDAMFIKWRGGVLSGEGWRARRLKYVQMLV